MDERALPDRVVPGAGVSKCPVSGALPHGQNERVGDGPFQLTTVIRRLVRVPSRGFGAGYGEPSCRRTFAVPGSLGLMADRGAGPVPRGVRGTGPVTSGAGAS
jgi:hypothetical protein